MREGEGRGLLLASVCSRGLGVHLALFNVEAISLRRVLEGPCPVTAVSLHHHNLTCFPASLKGAT